MSDDLYISAITKWGFNAQKALAIEECAELIVELTHDLRGRNSNVPEELADVQIMVEQLILIYGPERVESHKKSKLDRLAKRLKV